MGKLELVKLSATAAIDSLTDAARRGHIDAALMLAEVQALGVGAEPDAAAALHWVKVAILSDPDAVARWLVRRFNPALVLPRTKGSVVRLPSDEAS